MALRLKQKESIVEKMNSTLSSALSVVVVDYRGLTSAEMTELRSKARATDVKLEIIRNTLARRAFGGTSFECLVDAFKGPTLVATADKEPSATARLLRDFAKNHDKLKIKALSLGDTLLDASQVERVASLPTKEEAIARLLSVMQAPITKLVQTIAEPHAKLVRTIAAVRDKKQAEGN